MERQLLMRRFPATEVLAASATLQRSVVAQLEDQGIEGGAVYDGLIGLTARQHGEVLLTRDRRAVRTYELLDVAYELLED